MKKTIAIVTGANRGLGRGVVTGLAQLGIHVIATGRKMPELEEVVNECRQMNLSAESFYCDVTDESSINLLAEYTESSFSKLDILVNNAGLLPDRLYQTLPEIPIQNLHDAFNTNALGAYRMMLKFLPLLQKSQMARVVNVSSLAGQLSQMQGRLPAYRTSKAALNALTRVVAAEYSNEKLKINAVCPGWVKTAMGGRNAPLSVEEGAAGILWAATLGPDGPSGGFFTQQKPLDW